MLHLVGPSCTAAGGRAAAAGTNCKLLTGARAVAAPGGGAAAPADGAAGTAAGAGSSAAAVAGTGAGAAALLGLGGGLPVVRRLLLL